MIDADTILNKLKEVGIPDEYAQKAADAIAGLIKDKLGDVTGGVTENLGGLKGLAGGLLGGKDD